jgi:hypothetical protein
MREPSDGLPDAVIRPPGTYLGQHAVRREPERSRVACAAARVDEHAARELYFLKLAVAAPDEESACELENHAYEAYCDAEALRKEHELDC